MFSHSGKVIVMTTLTWIAVSMATEIIPDDFDCTSIEEEAQPTFIDIQCANVFLESELTACLRIQRNNERGLIRLNYTVTPIHTDEFIVRTRTVHSLAFLRPGYISTRACVRYLSDNRIPEQDERYRIELTATSRGTIRRSRGIVTIMDDDP